MLTPPLLLVFLLPLSPPLYSTRGLSQGSKTDLGRARLPHRLYFRAIRSHRRGRGSGRPPSRPVARGRDHRRRGVDSDPRGRVGHFQRQEQGRVLRGGGIVAGQTLAHQGHEPAPSYAGLSQRECRACP